MNYKSKISSFLDEKRDDMIELLCRLVSVPSIRSEAVLDAPYGKEVLNVLKIALNEAQKLGLDGNCFEGRADIIDCGPREQKLAILCHLDVVPVQADGWKYSPFEPTVEDNMIYGRGVSDNKGPAVAVLYALYAIKTLGIPLKYGVRLYLGGSEENGQDDLVAYLKENSLPEFVFTPDACFPVGNAERGRIKITADKKSECSKLILFDSGSGVNIIPDTAKAVLLNIDVEKIRGFTARYSDVSFDISENGDEVSIISHGKSTHAAHPQWGVNALTALLEIVAEFTGKELAELSKCFPHGVFNGSGLGLDGGLDISITQLRIDEGRMFFTADGRVNLNSSAEKLAEVIKAHLPCTVDMVVREPHYVSPDSEIVQKLNKVYEGYTDYKGGTYTLDAMTYAHSVPGSVIFGGVLPNDGCSDAHGINECYSLDTLVESAKIFAGAIIEFCN